MPFSGGGRPHTSGTELAPEKIAQAYISSFGGIGIEKIELDSQEASSSLEKIEKACSSTTLPFAALGGDHSITYPIVKSLSKKVPGLGLVVLDAHPDLMPSFELPLHDNWLRMLIEQGVVDSKKVILFGIRSIDPQEESFLVQKKILNYRMNEIISEGIREVCDAITMAARSLGVFHLSIDIDFIDPAFAPGTGFAEPGGLSSGEALYLLSRLSKLAGLTSFDIVEVNPKLDSSGSTSKLASRILAVLRQSFIKPRPLVK